MPGKEILNNMSAYKQGMQISEVKRKFNLEKIVKLASNENPYGYSDKIKEALENIPFNFEYYPDGYAYDLRMKAAEKLNVEPDQLVFGAGSDEIVTLICRTFLYPGKNTVMAKPTFPQYRQHALIEGAEVKEITTVNGEHDLEAMLAAIDENTEVVWICTPDNPSGAYITKEQFENFMEKCPEDVIVVLDAAYIEYVEPELRYPFNEYLKRYHNLIILRTFSKIYGLAGLRVGYGITTETIADKLNIVRSPFNTGSLSQKIAMIALDDDEFIEKARKLNERVKVQFTQFLDSIGWSYYPSYGNFLLVKTPIDADIASDFLLKHGFIVRSGNYLGYPNTMRITLGTEEDMQELFGVFQKLQEAIQNGVFE